MPSRLIDYPAMALPTLTATLRRAGHRVTQIDANMLFYDRLLTEGGLTELMEHVLPTIERRLWGVPQSWREVRRVRERISWLRKHVGLQALSETKEAMQRREYGWLAREGRELHMQALFDVQHILHSLCLHLAMNDDIRPNPMVDLAAELISVVESEKPDVVGLTMITNSSTQRPITLWFIQLLRKLFDGLIVVGGGDPTRIGQSLMREFPEIDYAVCGDGERALDILGAIAGGQNVQVSSVPGLVYRSGNGVKSNPPETNLDVITSHPDYTGLPMELYLSPVIPVLGSKGCPGRCKFCAHKYSYHTHYVLRPPEDVVDEIVSLKQSRATRLFDFVDELDCFIAGEAFADGEAALDGFAFNQ